MQSATVHLVSLILCLIPILHCSSCLKRYEAGRNNDVSIHVVEDGKLRHMKNVGFYEVSFLRHMVGIFMFEECADDAESKGDLPCWPRKERVSSNRIRKLLDTMPDYRDPYIVTSLARRYPPDDRARVVLGTRPLVVGVETRRTRAAPGSAYIAQDETMHLPVEALVVHPDFGGTDEPLLIEFPEPLKIKDVLDRLAAGEEWSSFGELRTLPPLPDPPRPAKRYSPP